jgi:acyl-CoA reductase-like NAD-dependent aldehyde dehydrogenase
MRPAAGQPGATARFEGAAMTTMRVVERVLAGRDGGGVPRFGSFVGGSLDPVGEGDADGAIEVLDPATGSALAWIEDAADAGVARAVDAGAAAARAWAAVPARDRGALVTELARRVTEQAGALALLDALDTGNPIVAMEGDVAKGARLMAEAGGLALQVTGTVYPLPGLHYTQREPWGVVGRMITFNHPAMFACARLGTALVAGNAVVLKASELAPLAPLAIAELSAGLLPDGVVNVVSGGPRTGAALVADPRIERLTFTGSTATALRIQAAAAASGRVKTLSFELGGKNPIVVFPDVDLDEAAAAVVRGMNYTRVQGQSCGSTSRAIIHEDIAGPLLERVADRVARIRIGSPLDRATEMGSMITRSARDRCLEVVDRAASAGARVVAGATVPDLPELSGGSFLAPTVVDRVAPGSELALEEIFGPVLSVLRFGTEDEAVALANEGRYGLTAAVWTRDLDRAFRVAARLDAGYLWINDVETRYPAVPFGGWGDSGVGVEHGLEEVLSMTRIRSVNVRIR